MSSITLLPDECLRKIFEYCEVEDHFVLVEVCTRFKQIIQQIWKLYFKEPHLTVYKCIQINMVKKIKEKATTLNGSTLKCVLGSIYPFVEVMRIQNHCIRHSSIVDEMVQIINEFQFTKTSELHLIKVPESSLTDTCFPNIRTLDVRHSKIKFPQQWSAVENLALRHTGLNSSEIMEFVSQLKLKTLQITGLKQPIPEKYKKFEYFIYLTELSTDEFGMNEFLDALKCTKKLRKLEITYRNGISSISAELNTKLMALLEKHVVELSALFYPSHDTQSFRNTLKTIQDQVEQLPRLEKLTLVDCELKDIAMLSRVFPMLKSVVMNWEGMYDDIGVMKILNAAQQLDFIEFYYQPLSYPLPHVQPLTVHLDVAKIEKIRKKPITIVQASPKLHLGKINPIIVLSAPSNLVKITTRECMHKWTNVQYILG